MASGFIVEIAGSWLFITAGHVFLDIEQLQDDGYELSHFRFHDAAAVGIFGFGVPFHFDRGRLLPIRDDARGIDVAAYILHQLDVAALDSGGTVPIGPTAWQPVDRANYPLWSIMGIPGYSLRRVDSKLHYVLQQTPCGPTDGRPEGATPEQDEYRFYAKLRRIHGPEGTEGIKGLSGGPVFGVRVLNDGTVNYTLLGIQGGAFSEDRVTISQAAPFFFDLERMILDFRATDSSC